MCVVACDEGNLCGWLQCDALTVKMNTDKKKTACTHWERSPHHKDVA